ncbi:MAG: signal peptidase I [Clostridia bacterium]|nr:signal peptidase I [Clostridia bacterium]
MEENYTEEKFKSSGVFKGLFDIIESLSYAIIVVILLFTFFAKLTVVDGSSMENTLYEKQYLVVINPFFTYTPNQNDIVVIHGDFLGDRYDHPIVKRIIATGGQTVEINFSTKTVYVDDVLFEEPEGVKWSEGQAMRLYPTIGDILKDENGNVVYDDFGYPVVTNKYYDESTKILKVTVPEGHVFVMGDNRDASADSRIAEIGFVPHNYILGKVAFRIAPFTFF